MEEIGGQPMLSEQYARSSASESGREAAHLIARDVLSSNG